MRWREALFFLSVAVARPVPANQAYDELYRLYDYPPTLSRSAVPVCFHHGCATVRQVRIDDADWERVISHLLPAASDATGERPV